VHPDVLHGDWQKVKQGLLHVLAKTRDNWLPEDIYTYLKLNKLTLHLAYEDSVYTGFLILQPLAGWDGAELFVMLAYHCGGGAFTEQEWYIEQLKTMARQIGARRIKFQTKRKGYQRRALQQGFTLDHTQFQMEI
jgi:hypothetical protein